jgi:hypothetical protein
MSSWATSWAYEQDVKPCGTKAVLVALAHFADADGFCYPGQELLADMTAQGTSTVREHLKKLEHAGLINRQHRYGKDGKRMSDGFNLLAPAERLNYRRKSAVASGVPETPIKCSDYRQISAVDNTSLKPTALKATAGKPDDYRQISAPLQPDFSGTYKDEKYSERSGSGGDLGDPFDHFAVVEYSSTLQPEPPLSRSQAESIAKTVTDTPPSSTVWTDVLRTFKGNGYHPRHAGNVVDRYVQDMRKIANGQRDVPISMERKQTIREKIGVKL